MTTTRWRLLATTLTLAALGCGDKAERRRTKATTAPAATTASTPTPAAGGGSAPSAAPAAASGWGSIKGRLVWGGPDVPAQKEIPVEKDKEWCAGAGPLKEETLVVDKDTKGIKNVFVFLKEAKAVHADYPQSKADVEAAFAKKFEEENKIKLSELAKAIAEKKIQIKDVKAPTVLDQIRCTYVPHAFGVREGQTTIVLNPEPIAHNVKVTSFKPQNNANPNMPPGTAEMFQWVMDPQPINVQCSIHGWMQMYAMVFTHPYFAITDKDGNFELKNVPAGELALVIRSPKFIDVKGGKGSAKGSAVTVEAGKTLDLLEIKVQPD